MCKLIIMKKFHCIAKLIRNMANMIHRIWFIVVVTKKIKNAQAEHLECNARMSMIIEPIENFNTKTKMRRKELEEAIEQLNN